MIHLTLVKGAILSADELDRTQHAMKFIDILKSFSISGMRVIYVRMQHRLQDIMEEQTLTDTANHNRDLENTEILLTPVHQTNVLHPAKQSPSQK